MDINVVLHPTDGSRSSDKALAFASDLAKERDARLIVLHVQKRHGAHGVPDYLKDYERIEHVWATEAELLKSAAKAIVEKASDKARADGVSRIEAAIIEGDPAKVILDTIDREGVDAVVMGARGLGELEGLVLGSVSHTVSCNAPCTAIVVR